MPHDETPPLPPDFDPQNEYKYVRASIVRGLAEIERAHFRIHATTREAKGNESYYRSGYVAGFGHCRRMINELLSTTLATDPPETPND